MTTTYIDTIMIHRFISELRLIEGIMREKIILSLIIDLAYKYGNRQVIFGIGIGQQTRETSLSAYIIQIGRFETVKSKNFNLIHALMPYSVNRKINNQSFFLFRPTDYDKWSQ